MKNVFGIILIILGIICIPKIISPSGGETIGGLIGISLFTFLPAYFLLRRKKNENSNANKIAEIQNTSNSKLNEPKETYWQGYKRYYLKKSFEIEKLTGLDFSTLSNKDAIEKVESLERWAKNLDVPISQLKQEFINSFLQRFSVDEIPEVLKNLPKKQIEESNRLNISEQNTCSYWMIKWLNEYIEEVHSNPLALDPENTTMIQENPTSTNNEPNYFYLINLRYKLKTAFDESIQTLIKENEFIINDTITGELLLKSSIINLYQELQKNEELISTCNTLNIDYNNILDEEYKSALNKCLELNPQILNKDIDFYTSDYDQEINIIFPNSKQDALTMMEYILEISRMQAEILFDRWSYYHLIDYHPIEEWIPNAPIETLTIEQFKEIMEVNRIDVKRDNETGKLYFCYGDKKGLVLIKGIPKIPLISKVVCSNSDIYWILHEKGQIVAPSTIAIF